MATIQEIAEIKAHDWGFPFNHMLIEKLKMLVLPYMATIIQRRYDQTHKFPTSLIHTIKCVDLVVDKCSGINGVQLKRTEIQIPSPLITKADSSFIYVGEMNYTKSFSRETPESIFALQYRKFSGKDPYYFYDDKYIWVGNVSHLKHVAIRFVPNNPYEVIKLKNAEATCYTDEGDFDIELSLIDGITSLMEKHRYNIITPELKTEVKIDEV